VSDRWLKPDFQEIGVSGECTAYAGTQDERPDVQQIHLTTDYTDNTDKNKIILSVLSV
jgi:hypothetical protein